MGNKILQMLGLLSFGFLFNIDTNDLDFLEGHVEFEKFLVFLGGQLQSDQFKKKLAVERATSSPLLDLVKYQSLKIISSYSQNARVQTVKEQLDDLYQKMLLHLVGE